MPNADACVEFLAAVEQLHDEHTVRLTAHTSSVSADAWNTPEAPAPDAPAAASAD
ncbi:hypothetical protein ABZ565_29275 [Streptomyces sp. NPDC016469]|uniref:hypothetical protein n=1 Tax=Streptomyces sp. NPDC016469 TaxID=3157191 RepID=UPI00340BC92F